MANTPYQNNLNFFYMKNLLYATCLLFIAGCNSKAIKISGTAPNMDGNIVSVLNSSMNVMSTSVVENGKFTFEPFALQEPYYLTFSVQKGEYPRLYEIYLEPGEYTVKVPAKETDYLDIKTDSKIQNNLSSYYNYENSLVDKFRNELARWDAKTKDPKDKMVLDSGLTYVVERQEAARRKLDGAQIFAMSSYVEKHPNNESIPHIITNTYYKDNPVPYYTIFQKLAPAVKNSVDGKKLGAELPLLIKQREKMELAQKQMEEKEKAERQMREKEAAAHPPLFLRNRGKIPAQFRARNGKLVKLDPKQREQMNAYIKRLRDRKDLQGRDSNGKVIEPNTKEHEELLKRRRAAFAAFQLQFSKHRD